MTTSEVPLWLRGVAVAETVTAPLVALVAEAAGVQPPKDLPGFLDGLSADGVLDCDDPGDGVFRLDEAYRSVVLEELGQLPGGLHQVRDDLIRLGLTRVRQSLSGQLALWAHQNADWAALSALWLKYPPAVWGTMTQSSVGVFAQVPAQARQAHPVLSQAAAITAALDSAEAGSSSEQAVRRLRHDGRMLHSGWASLSSLDSAVRAGSIWMTAQRTMAGHPDPLDDAWATRRAVSALIDRQTLAGNSPTSTAQTFFHTTSATTAMLRGDLYQARSDCEQAMMLSQPGDIWALVGAALEALTLSIAGNPHGCQRAAEWFDAHEPTCGAFAGVANPYLHLALALKAIRALDRKAATEHLLQAAALEEGSEFWSAYAWIRSVHDLTWRDPDYGLARLDAAVARNPAAGGYETLSDTLAVGARADLLCSAGRVYEAKALLRAAANSKLNRYHLVSEARMHLCSLNAAEAIRVADRGAHDPAINAPGRAQLLLIRSAALRLLGAGAEAVRTDLRAACTLCTELTDVLPFVFLPAGLRAELLEFHDQISHEAPCVLDDPVIRERLGQVWANLESAPALVHLTPREEILLPLLATSATVDVIAKRLQVSVNTVRKQVVTLREKFGAPTRAAMISRAYALGLLAGRRAGDPHPIRR
ncbi:MAG: response regulator transcription factor [Propionicimonas sp.]